MSSPLALVCISNAEKHASKGEIGVACGFYLLAFTLNPEWKYAVGNKFSALLCEWGCMLEGKKRYSDLFRCYEEALMVLPDDVFILNNFGSHLLRCGYLQEAASYFRRCLSIHPHFLRAAHNLDEVLIMQVERWHFKMLNDQPRNKAFKNAITKKIKQGFDRVLDVGTGTGLLSLFCLEAKAKEIYACDVSPVMTEIAEQVFLSNHASDIKLIRKHSSKLQIPEDIQERVSLLVTETFDVGLLGEHILLTLIHAWEHLLLPPHSQNKTLNPGKFGVVIPHKAIMYATGIEFDKLANDFHLKRTNISSLFEDLNVLQACDNYDSQDLSHARYRFLTDTIKIFEINFNDPEGLLEFIKGWNKDMTITCKCCGRLDCIAVWFDLYLDEDIFLSTSPESKANSAWDQAIFLLPRSILVREEQNVRIAISFDTSKLNITLSGNSMDNLNFVVSDDVIRTLNNEKLTKELLQVVNKLSPAYNDPVTVLDCYPFPIFGLNLLRNRRSRFSDELICFMQTENDQCLVKHLAEKYGVRIDAVVKKKIDFPADYLSDKKFDIILLDLIEKNGEIKDEILLHLDFLKSILKPGGIILPEHVTVCGQFIYSHWLNKVSKVINSTVTCGYDIAEHINKYQVQHFIDFDLKSIGSITCTKPFELFCLFDSIHSTTEKTVSRVSVALANALVYWLKIKFTEECEEILTTDDTSYQQAAFLLSEENLTREITFKIIRDDGLFVIKLLND